jgi:hypothetical protein
MARQAKGMETKLDDMVYSSGNGNIGYSVDSQLVSSTKLAAHGQQVGTFFLLPRHMFL